MLSGLPLFLNIKTDSKTDTISIFYAQVFLKNTVAELKDLTKETNIFKLDTEKI